jgi:hypothetical protein
MMDGPIFDLARVREGSALRELMRPFRRRA